MTRLIDADALREQFKDRSLEDFTYLHFIDAIDNAPTVEERPHGKWVNFEQNLFYKYAGCSCCHANTPDVSTYVNMNYCPNCGADMREGDT